MHREKLNCSVYQLYGGDYRLLNFDDVCIDALLVDEKESKENAQ